MKSPFTKQDAERISAEYQYLIGTRFNPSNAGSGIIECIAITPYDIINKQKFILYYLLLDNCIEAEKSLKFSGNLFDVVVIARTDKDDLEHTDIINWLNKNQDSVIHYATIDSHVYQKIESMELEDRS